jgi:hypothetical protein
MRRHSIVPFQIKNFYVNERVKTVKAIPVTGREGP